MTAGAEVIADPAVVGPATGVGNAAGVGNADGVEIVGLHKSFVVAGRTVPVLTGLDFTQRPGITVVLGASGCGKTTLLRLIAGMETADAGTIRYDGAGQIGMVFQEPRLMPWLSTAQNIRFGQRPGRCDVPRLLALTGLTEFADALPHQLSGGMQHRVALARALANDPALILMDEPFAALDHLTRERMQDQLRELQRAEQKNILLVTHSIDEAVYLGDRIIILQAGRIAADHDLTHLSRERDRDSDRALTRHIRSTIQKDT